ncbi:MAG: hypothetical protein DRN20_05150 [Thermoplasmata archaeon]|nr:MAG: hypothetical protein DRN20_05150 [Thermoplasmata archaeon]
MRNTVIKKIESVVGVLKAQNIRERWIRKIAKVRVSKQLFRNTDYKMGSRTLTDVEKFSEPEVSC